MAALVMNVVQRLDGILALTDSLLTAEKAKVAVIKQEANNGFMVSTALKPHLQLPFFSFSQARKPHIQLL
jgi:hypothetical protein